MSKKITDTAAKKANIAINDVMLGGGWKHKWLNPGGQPRVDITGKTIYTPPFGYMNEREDDIVRGCDIHENAHALFTPEDPSKKWNAVYKEMVNALEDRRVESAVSQKWTGAGPALAKMNRHMYDDWNKGIEENPQRLQEMGDVRQAIIYVHFSDMGLIPNWKPSAKAQEYIDLIGDKYTTWRDVYNVHEREGYYGILDLAKELVDMLVQNEQDKQNEEEQEQQEQESGQGEGESQDSENQEGEGSESESGSESEESDGEGQEGQGNGSSDNGEEQDGSKGGSQSNDDNVPQNDLDKELDDLANGNDGDDEEDEEGNGSNGDSDDSEDSEDSDGQDSDGDSDGEGNQSDSNSNSNSNKSGKQDSSDNDDKGNPSGQDNNDKGLSEEEILKQLCDQLNGESPSESLEKTVGEISKKSAITNDNYLADTRNDQWLIPDENEQGYNNSRKMINSNLAQFKRFVEQSLKSLAKNRKQTNLERGKLNKRSLHKLSKSISKNVFFRTLKGKSLNTCVSITIDESGSMSSKVGQMRALAIALGECLDQLDIPFEIIGSTTKGGGYSLPNGFSRTNPIIHRVYKSFNERYNAVKTRLGGISSYNNNVDGEVVENAAFRMRGRKEMRKVIFSLSDGEPYAGHPNSDDMEKNLINVCKRLRDNGYEVYGFGVETNAPAKFYGKEHFVYLDSVSTMGMKFFKRFFEVISKGM